MWFLSKLFNTFTHHLDNFWSDREVLYNCITMKQISMAQETAILQYGTVSCLLTMAEVTEVAVNGY